MPTRWKSGTVARSVVQRSCFANCVIRAVLLMANPSLDLRHTVPRITLFVNRARPIGKTRDRASSLWLKRGQPRYPSRSRPCGVGGEIHERDHEDGENLEGHVSFAGRSILGGITRARKRTDVGVNGEMRAFRGSIGERLLVEWTCG